jgi:hypothetical protein
MEPSARNGSQSPATRTDAKCRRATRNPPRPGLRPSRCRRRRPWSRPRGRRRARRAGRCSGCSCTGRFSTGRRNASMRRVAMRQARRRAADRAGRPRMRSPGRPSVARWRVGSGSGGRCSRRLERGGGRRDWRVGSGRRPVVPRGWRDAGREGVNLRCLTRHQSADTKRTHQKRHTRRLATHLRHQDRSDLQEKLCRE